MSRVETIGAFKVTFVGDERVVAVYAISPAAGAPVYVGSTSQLLRNRIRAHIMDAQSGSAIPLHRWLRANPNFAVTILERTTETERHARERHWVAQFSDLLNMTDGGPGMSGHRFAGTPHAASIAAAIRTGVTKPCEQCGSTFYRKRSQAVKGKDRFCSRACYQNWQRGRSKPARAA